MCFVFNVNIFLTEGCGQRHLKATDLTPASYMLGSRDSHVNHWEGETPPSFYLIPWFLTKNLCDKPEVSGCC